ncbi:PH domain-containing protein [Paenibacillus albidus]|uniref:PH domain-containing protein n=1 Tax=Paenibacillus albidus TaxID=2041023 RepID=UPI001BE538E8|nr:PH domain-containing protein [Paenibacillus albidus]MBT2289360.1 PH domain-containing protein [Paenibacillus albidus]
MDAVTAMREIDKSVIKARRLEGWITIAVYTVITLALLYLTVQFHWPWWIVIVAAVLTVVSIPFEIILLPAMKYRTWRYRIQEHEIELHHGIWFRKQTLIPFVRIQHVDAKQGPILRRYRLSTVTFSTAAGSHEIPALSEQTAEQVRKQIAANARVAHEEI